MNSKRKERYKYIALVCALLIMALFFLFVACNDLTMDASPAEIVIKDSAPDMASEDAAAGKDKTADIPDNNKETIQAGEGQGTATEGQTTEGQTAEEQQGTTQENAPSNDDAQGNAQTTDGTQSDGQSDETGTKEGDGATEGETPEVRDGYTRMSGVSFPTEWTVYVFDRNVGKAVVRDGYLVTSAFTENTIPLWGKASDNQMPTFYLYFETTEKYHEALFRTELPVVQIDMTEQELSLLLFVSSLDEGEKEEPISDEPSGKDAGDEPSGDGKTNDSQGEVGGSEQNVGEESDDTNEEEAQQPTQNGDPEPSGETEQNGDPEPSGDLEPNGDPEPSGDLEPSGEPQSNGENEEQNEVPNAPNGSGDDEEAGEEPGGGTTEQPEGIERRCQVCGALLTEGGAHDASCDNYASIPAKSEAHDFLNALPGVRENLTLSFCDEESEAYSFVLNYLSETGIEEIKTVMRSCKVLNETELGEGSLEYRVQKALGAKVFTFVARVTAAQDYYTATISVTGFAL